jgi:hypothetical protein
MPILRMPILLSVVSVMISKPVYNMTIDCVCLKCLCVLRSPGSSPCGANRRAPKGRRPTQTEPPPVIPHPESLAQAAYDEALLPASALGPNCFQALVSRPLRCRPERNSASSLDVMQPLTRQGDPNPTSVVPASVDRERLGERERKSERGGEKERGGD